MGWSSVYESSNIGGLQDIEMRQPKLFNADFAVKTSEFDLRRRTLADKVLAFRSFLNEANAAAEDPLGPQMFQMSVAPFKHLSESGHLCKPKMNENQTQRFAFPSKWCFNAKLNRSEVVSRCGEIWGRLARQEGLGADWRPGQWLRFSRFLKKYRKNEGLVRAIFNTHARAWHWHTLECALDKPRHLSQIWRLQPKFNGPKNILHTQTTYTLFLWFQDRFNHYNSLVRQPSSSLRSGSSSCGPAGQIAWSSGNHSWRLFQSGQHTVRQC